MLVMANRESELGCFWGTVVAYSPLYCPTIERTHHSSRNGEFQVVWRYSYFACFAKIWEVLSILSPYIYHNGVKHTRSLATTIPQLGVKHRGQHRGRVKHRGDVKHRGG